MDYGKLAYIKAEELEARLLAGERRFSSESSASLSVQPNALLTEGYTAAYVRAGGRVTVFAAVTVRVDAGQVSEVVLSVGGHKACSAPICGEIGEWRELLLFCSAYAGGDAEVTVSADGECTLMSCRLLVSGSDARLVRTGGSANTDRSGEVWALAECEGDDVRAYLFTEENFALSDPVYLGTGMRADVAGGADGFAFAYADDLGQVFVVFAGLDLTVKRRVFVTGGGRDAAIAACENGWLLAVVTDAGIDFFALGEDGGFSAPMSLISGKNIERVHFVKNCFPPAIVVGERDRSYLVRCEREYGGSAAMGVSGEMTVTAAGVSA